MERVEGRENQNGTTVKEGDCHKSGSKDGSHIGSKKANLNTPMKSHSDRGSPQSGGSGRSAGKGAQMVNSPSSPRRRDSSAQKKRDNERRESNSKKKETLGPMGGSGSHSKSLVCSSKPLTASTRLAHNRSPAATGTHSTSPHQAHAPQPGLFHGGLSQNYHHDHQHDHLHQVAHGHHGHHGGHHGHAHHDGTAKATADFAKEGHNKDNLELLSPLVHSPLLQALCAASPPELQRRSHGHGHSPGHHASSAHGSPTHKPHVRNEAIASPSRNQHESTAITSPNHQHHSPHPHSPHHHSIGSPHDATLTRLSHALTPVGGSSLLTSALPLLNSESCPFLSPGSLTNLLVRVLGKAWLQAMESGTHNGVQNSGSNTTNTTAGSLGALAVRNRGPGRKLKDAEKDKVRAAVESFLNSLWVQYCEYYADAHHLGHHSHQYHADHPHSPSHRSPTHHERCAMSTSLNKVSGSRKLCDAGAGAGAGAPAALASTSSESPTSKSKPETEIQTPNSRFERIENNDDAVELENIDDAFLEREMNKERMKEQVVLDRIIDSCSITRNFVVKMKTRLAGIDSLVELYHRSKKKSVSVSQGRT